MTDDGAMERMQGERRGSVTLERKAGEMIKLLYRGRELIRIEVVRVRQSCQRVHLRVTAPRRIAIVRDPT